MAVSTKIRRPTKRINRLLGLGLITAVLFAVAVSLTTPVRLEYPLILIVGWALAEAVLVGRTDDLPKRLSMLIGFMVLATLIDFVALHHVLYQDESYYDGIARLLLAHSPVPAQDNQWSAFVAFLYGHGGSAVLTVRLFNSAVTVVFVALLVDVAETLMPRTSAHRLYWLAGLSPALLVWSVSALRDLSIAFGVLCIFAAVFAPRRRLLRAGVGVVLLWMLRPIVLLLPAAALLVLPLLAWRRRPGTATIGFGLLGFSAATVGVRAVDEFSASELTSGAQSFVVARNAESSSALTSPIFGLVDRLGNPFGLIPGLVLALLLPVWFAVFRSGTFTAFVTGVGGIGWYLLLPSVWIGAVHLQARDRLLAVWAALALAAAAETTLTVFQDPARMRLIGLGAFFLLAATGIDRSPQLARYWTRLWAIVNASLAMMYMLLIVSGRL